MSARNSVAQHHVNIKKVQTMNEMILAKMREGDWGAVVRLMREEREGGAAGGQPKAEPGRPMPFKERFETVRITPQKVADSVVEENGRFKALSVEARNISHRSVF